MTAAEPFLLSGEFHYFRVPREAWASRLKAMAGAGLGAASIYVPWNWHHAVEGSIDLTGATGAGRDLAAVLDEIAAAGLQCVMRPGPFITAEWRQGGIPDWFLGRHPGAAALDSAGRPAGAGRLYPAITYAHPAYRGAVRGWLETVFDMAAGYLATRGGPIINVQLDDEPSYWQRLSGPLAVDYNPVLVEAAGGPSRFAAWLLEHRGSLDAVNRAYGTGWSAAGEVVPPRSYPDSIADLPRLIDWLEFKLAEVNDYIGFLVGLARDAGIDVRLSMLHPYLLPLSALRCREYLRSRDIALHLTNECYLALFSGSPGGEHKLGSILACHETYLMWAIGENGPPTTMELQGSNATYLTPGAMEGLYALTVARGIRGINYFMMVGGANPPGFENATGAEYDIAAPISATGERRPHYQVIAKLSSIVRGWAGERLADATPLRDVWLGCYQPYEAAVLSGGERFGLDGFGDTFSGGDLGTSEAASLASLFALTSVSFGCLDLETASDERLAAIGQLWLPGGPFLSRAVQERLAGYVRGGGHLVVMPAMPALDEEMRPCSVLGDLILGGAPQPGGTSAEATILYGSEGETLVAVGTVHRWHPPAGATALVHDAAGGTCAFACRIGAGMVTVIGFHLRYMPTAGVGQHAFTRRVVRSGGQELAAWATALPCAAFQLQGSDAGLVCVVNPVDLPARPRVFFSRAVGAERTRMPLVLPAVTFSGRGARLLPVSVSLGPGATLRHATWELLAVEHRGGDACLSFASRGERGEVALAGTAGPPRMEGGRVTERRDAEPDLEVFVIEPEGAHVGLVVSAGGQR